jgi:hypothetical protein
LGYPQKKIKEAMMKILKRENVHCGVVVGTTIKKKTLNAVEG